MKVGSYVICINAKHWHNNAAKYFNKLPVEGTIYEIRRIIPDFTGKYGPEGLALYGIKGKWDTFKSLEGNDVYEEYHFRKDSFREVFQDDQFIELIREYSLSEVVKEPIDQVCS